jgi:uncharacterized protein involved in response to NO
MQVLFALGFRPFFLLSGVFAILLMGMWVPVFVGAAAWDTYYGQIGWHSHEMIFGYTVAVIAGFLLTAVRNWTGKPTGSGGYLAALAALWLVGRILPIFSGIAPRWLIAVADLAFLPALAVVIGVPLVRSGETRNLIFLPLMAVLWLANGFIHAEILGLLPNFARTGVFLAVDLIVLLIVIMGGRVIPFFTERALPGLRIERRRAIEWLAPISVIAFLFGELFVGDSRLSGALAALAAMVNGVRLATWHTHRYWQVPLLWVLHSGYGWVVVGFLLKAAAGFGVVSPQFTIHAFTVGAIGVLTVGMMARVSLGHTARPLRVTASMVVAFVLLNLAAFARGLLPLFFPLWFSQLIVASGALWIAAFVIFTVVHAPILTQSRLDGQPG